MLKKILVSTTILILILALASVSAVAQSGPAKGGKPTGTLPPDDPPIPTQVPDTGNLYGDLYVILRNENGVPILDDEVLVDPESGEDIVVWCIQPISLVDASITIPTYDDGELTIDAYAGEPFALPTYVDIEGDLVECELTEEMTTWVQSVDFGRLNLGRAPDSVIAHAFDEAINKMNAATAIDLDPAGRLMMVIDGEWKTIDAPAENLALYIKMMQEGHWITLDTTPVEPGGGGGKGGGGGGGGRPEGDGPSTEPRPVLSESAIALLGGIGYANLGDETNVLNNHDVLLAASLLAASADKGGTFTLDKVVYINAIYDINFDFSVPYGDEPYLQDRVRTYGNRSSGGCRNGWIWVLQPTGGNNYSAMCKKILDSVHFTDMVEAYTTVEDADGNPLSYDFTDNVRGFAQSADDALRVIEYIHNYKVPEVLYE